MAADNQQFCLRWNNHQSTLISVFDTLLESGTLVDCTLAAEGQYLKAHKVVLSACSPYLELLLSQHYEKHPIVILKDVKFQELKSMMDYMYRGEVNISQDKLSTFLKAAESLQIKGLTDGGGTEEGAATTAPAKAPIATPVRKPVQQQSVTRGPSASAQGLTIERRPESPHIRSRDDSASPTPRKRRRNLRRPSTSDDPDSHIDTSNSCDVPPLQSGALSGIGVPNIPATITKGAPLDDGDHETENSRINNHDEGVEGVAGPKIEPTGELIEPKTEYLEEMNNEDSIEDLTLDDDDDMDNSMDMSRAGPSHDNSNQSFGQWPITGNQSTDEVFMSAQEAVGAHRDTQVTGDEMATITATQRVVNNHLTNFNYHHLSSVIKYLNNQQQHQQQPQQTKTWTTTNALSISQRYFEKIAPVSVGIPTLMNQNFYDMQDSGSDASGHDGYGRHRRHNRDKEPIFQCPDCDKRYRSKTSLSLHKRLECGKEPAFQCPYCPLKTHQKGNLQVHIKKKHNDHGELNRTY